MSREHFKAALAHQRRQRGGSVTTMAKDQNGNELKVGDSVKVHGGPTGSVREVRGNDVIVSIVATEGGRKVGGEIQVTGSDCQKMQGSVRMAIAPKYQVGNHIRFKTLAGEETGWITDVSADDRTVNYKVEYGGAGSTDWVNERYILGRA
jgi:FKBP-type peptidyl-prolyl cis-trans isomerase 2